jgi:hypothetical protein
MVTNLRSKNINQAINHTKGRRIIMEKLSSKFQIAIADVHATQG